MRELSLLDPMHLPCGGTAYWDESSGISYRCECGSVVGSIGMAYQCKSELKKWEAYENEGLWKWDYIKGKPVNT
jgi:hypothetical protein